MFKVDASAVASEGEGSLQRDEQVHRPWGLPCQKCSGGCWVGVAGGVRGAESQG